jgi:hypothetical protein
MFYIIRHKATGYLMPQARHNKGYTHWNPSSAMPFRGALKTPRLFTTANGAKKAIRAWFGSPNATVRYYEDGPDDWKIKQDGRKLEDLEIREINFIGLLKRID